MSMAIAVSSPSSAAMPSNARLPQVYQIDFTAVASGKRIASTKRRVRWRFGFANPEALANGETGTACRGEEHDITLVWSVTSGKRLILADGQEVHYSNSRSGVLDFSWTMRGNHVLKVVAHASPPLSASPGFRQYDFFVDGQSFFTFPKVYKLGLSANDPRAAGSPVSPPALAHRSQPYNNYSVSSPQRNRSTDIAAIEAPHTADEEEAYLKEAIKLSLQEPAAAPSAASVASGGQGGASTQGGEPNLLIDFMSEAPAPVAPAPVAVPALPAPVPAANTNGYGYAAQPVSQPPIQQFPALPAPAPADQSFGIAPQPSLTDISTGFPSAAAPVYDSTPSTGVPAPGVPYAQQPGAAAAAPYSQQEAPAVGFASPAPQPAFASPEPQPAVASPPVAQFPTATVAPAFGGVAQQAPAADPWGAPAAANVAPESAPAPEPAPPTVDPAALTMNSLSGQMGSLAEDTGTGASLADQAYNKLANLGDFDLVSKKESPRANPFESSSSSVVGGQASLADMKAMGKKEPKKDIMKSPAAPPAGAMVVSSTQQQGNYGGYGQYGASPMSQPGQNFGQQTAYGATPMNQPMQNYGQAPPYGAQPQYGQPQPPAQMQQAQYGQQPAPPAAAQPQYGQQYQQQGFGAPAYQQGY